MFCCNPAFDPAQAIFHIKRMFHSENVQYQVIRR
ncbi:hypothetical protein EBU71_13510 [bacterium]|nr:hypothetical protein [Candidatus Elulimicrobium humile]